MYQILRRKSVKKLNPQAFTLAEIMIVLSVIGILTAMLLPVAFHSAPDENIMKFKKANNTLGMVVRELVTSDKYYSNGDLGVMPDGTDVSSATYLCETMADIMSVKKVDCQSANSGYGGNFAEDWKINNTMTDEVVDYADNICKASQEKIKPDIITPDDINWYFSNPSVLMSNPIFYNVWDKNPDHVYDTTAPGYLGTYPDSEWYGNTKWPGNGKLKNGYYYLYKIICVDVDGIKKGEDPFGYGIRVDGKIFMGRRASEWVNKSVQNKD